MLYLLSVTFILGTDRPEVSARSRPGFFSVEIELGAYAYEGLPETLAGVFIKPNPLRIAELQTRPGVEVIFRGGGYRFEELELSGNFRLKRT